MTTRKRWLIVLANFIKAVHHVYLPLLGCAWLLLFCLAKDAVIRGIALRGGIYTILGVGVSLLFTQILFRGPRGGDCALSVFEFSLRGLGGEEFDLKRLHSMVVLADRGMSREKICRYLLLKSGVFLLVTTLLVMTTVILLEHFIS